MKYSKLDSIKLLNNFYIFDITSIDLDHILNILQL